MTKVEVFDTTLRDGAQARGISFSVKDKIAITQALDEFGVDFIEAGNPGSNPKDLEFFELIKNIELKTSKLVAFGSTRRKDAKAEIDDLYYGTKGLAKKLQKPIWSVSQVNRSGAKDDVVEGDKSAGSYDKLMVVDFSMSLSRLKKDKVNGY